MLLVLLVLLVRLVRVGLLLLPLAVSARLSMVVTTVVAMVGWGGHHPWAR